MNLGSMNIGVTKIANGYLISYHIPKRKKNKYKSTAEEELFTFVTGQYTSTVAAPENELQWWYCPTKQAVEDALPRILMECYHAHQLMRGKE